MKEFTKSYGIKRVAELTEEVEALRRAIKTYQEINKRTTDALVEACDELAIYKIGTGCLLCDPACKLRCKAMNWKECSTRMQIHFLKMRREDIEDVKSSY